MVRFWIQFEGRANSTYHWVGQTARCVALAAGNMELAFPETGKTVGSRRAVWGRLSNRQLLLAPLPRLNTHSHASHFVLLNYSAFPKLVLPFHVSGPLYLLCSLPRNLSPHPSVQKVYPGPALMN